MANCFFFLPRNVSRRAVDLRFRFEAIPTKDRLFIDVRRTFLRMFNIDILSHRISMLKRILFSKSITILILTDVFPSSNGETRQNVVCQSPRILNVLN